MSTDSPVNLITDPAELSIGVVCASFNSDLTNHVDKRQYWQPLISEK